MFLYAENLVSDNLTAGIEPWEFKCPDISRQIRESKEDRQAWYKSVDTKHHFYTGIEPMNPNLRINVKDNPPVLIRAFTGDYDIKCPQIRIDEAIAAMKIKPAWVETSLGGNFRLIYTLKTPLRCNSQDFCSFILLEAREWLGLDLLPGLDQNAWESPTRLYCNGGVFRSTGFGDVREIDAQAFFVQCGKKFRFKAPDDANVPLDVVEAGLKKKFESYVWPDAFELESAGPSFWVPGSASTNSAIIKAGGMFTFSAHAEKEFYTWTDLLGAEFVKEFMAGALTKAVEDCWYDGKKYWRRVLGDYAFMDKDDFILFLKVDCRLSAKNGSDGVSPIDTARQHIHNHNRVASAGPFVFQKPGLVEFMGEKRLNTYTGKPLPPAPGKHSWGTYGTFPFISALLEAIFYDPEQLIYWLAWFQYYYRAAYEWMPLPGPHMIMCGGVGCGKTFLNRRIVGTAVGGYADASDFLVNESPFNSHLMRVPHWCLDDDTPASGGFSGRSKVASMIKKMAGNQQFLNNEKFQVAGMVAWMGRIGVTTNLDFTSLRIIGTLDNNALDKFCLLRCVEKSLVDFPTRYDLEKIIQRELPCFLRWLLDWAPPDTLQRDSRYGWKTYHNPYLLERTHQGSSVAPFKELLIEALKEFFAQNPEAKEFTGTVTQIHRLICSDPRNTELMRGHKPEQMNRYLEQLQSEKLISCSAGSGNDKVRIWIFPRF